MSAADRGARPRAAPASRSHVSSEPSVAAPDGPADDESCDYCGSTALEWRKCKLICRGCAQINKSCADL